MTGRERRRKVLEKVTLIGGALSVFAVIGVIICFVQIWKVGTETQQISARHVADVQDFREEDEILYEKIVKLEVSNKLAKMGFEEEKGTPINADVKVENIGDNSSMITTVENNKGIKEALSDPYLFIKTQDEVEISVQTDFIGKVIIKVYFLKDLDYNYNTIKESLEHPIIKNALKDGQFKKQLNETGIYLVELSGQNTEELYFAIDLK